jgi:hypothetical protein
MSEKIYACLLRLYPAHFRKAYGEEALLLFRDRARDESGFLPRLRLWLDLLGDLAISIPREYRAAPAAIAPTRAADGMPAFHVLDDETLSLRAMLYGTVASLLFYGCVAVLVSHARATLPLGASDFQRAPRHSGAMAKPMPTVALSYTPSKPAPGATIRLTATVSGTPYGSTPTGRVRFYDRCDLIETAALDNGTITVKGKLPHGSTHSIRAVYYGDNNYSAADSTPAAKPKALRYR